MFKLRRKKQPAVHPSIAQAQNIFYGVASAPSEERMKELSGVVVYLSAAIRGGETVTTETLIASKPAGPAIEQIIWHRIWYKIALGCVELAQEMAAMPPVQDEVDHE